MSISRACREFMLPFFLSLVLFLCASCAKHVKTLPSGAIVISGAVNDATGLSLPDRSVKLFRENRYLLATTDPTGHYAFPGLAPASYLLLPAARHCRVIPRDVYLNNLAASFSADFTAFGPACGGQLAINAGAMSGPLTISGHVKDGAGLAVIGARVALGEHHIEAVRFTDFTGSYTFHVKSGDQDFSISGACAITPRKISIDDMKADAVRDFTAGPGCVTSAPPILNPTGAVFTIHDKTTVLGTTYVRVEDFATPAAAMARLNAIAAEQPTPSKPLTILGFPAIERETSVTLPGLDPDIAGAVPPAGPFFALTTAIADGSTVVRFESQLPKEATPATIAQFFQFARNFTPDALNSLHGPARPTRPTTKNTSPSAPAALAISASAIVAPAFGELVVASSDTANAIVYGTQGGPFLSSDGGQTVAASTYNTAAAPPAAAFNSKGDPAVAVGAPDSTFHQTLYFAQLEQAAPAPATGNTPIVAVSLYSSADNGKTFNSISFPVNCSVAGAGCVVPDQEQLAADRITRVVTPAGSTDQLYLAWRNYNAQNSNAHTIAVACSTDGGLNWTTDPTTLAATGADFPRLSVGPDGSLLAAFAAYTGATYALQTQKWDSCAKGFKPSGTVQTLVKTVTEVTDMAGLDRPANGNYSPAYDDSDGSAQRIFVVYSNEASSGNDDIHVIETRDGGTTWPLDSIVSTNSNGHKFFPYTCSTVGKKFVTWYDRRDSTAASPDLTAFYRSTVTDNGSASAVGVGAETNVSGVDDAQCLPGFSGAGTRSALEETACKNLPAGFIQGGTCQLAICPAPPAACGTLAACDFRAANPCAPVPITKVAQVCTPIGGAPKYGDYNGSACSQGTLYTAWASATPPTGSACLISGVASATAAKCCSGILSGGTCAASAAACVANGGACGGATPCCSQTSGGQCQANRCMPAVAMYTGSSNISLPPPPSSPVIITYHQTGACNGFVDGSGGHSAGVNQAYVFFGIEKIDNSGSSSKFNFDPANLFVQQSSQDFFDSLLSVYAGIFGPFAIQATPINGGAVIPFAPVAQGATVVSTVNTDGSTEANQTAYFLQYNRQPSDPLIVLVKSDASRTSWPNTQDCTTVTLQ